MTPNNLRNSHLPLRCFKRDVFRGRWPLSSLSQCVISKRYIERLDKSQKGIEVDVCENIFIHSWLKHVNFAFQVLASEQHAVQKALKH